MANEIYISYRRADAAAEARQLHEALAQWYDPQSVVMDIGAITAGGTFLPGLGQVLAEVKVLLVVIGRRWAEPFHRDAAGRGVDFVQWEVERALAQGMTVIPVLVGGASVPSGPEIPFSLARLGDLRSAILRRDHFQEDVNRLIVRIEAALQVHRQRSAADAPGDESGQSDAPASATEPAARSAQARPTAPAAAETVASPRSPGLQRAVSTGLRSALARARPAEWFSGRHIRSLAAALGLAALLAAGIYGLARVAVASLPPVDVALRSLPGDARIGPGGPIAVAIDDQGATRLVTARGPASGFGGRAEQARITAGGQELIATGPDGAVRAHRVDGFGAGMMSSFAALSPAWRQQLWPAFGQPLADGALQLAAQFASFDIPDAARGRRGRAFRDCKDDVCGPLMVEIGPGRFFTGSAFAWRGDGPRRLETIATPFAIARFETTWRDWTACFLDGICSWRGDAASEAAGGENHPIGMVNWDDAGAQYVAWLNRKLGLSGPLAYRLPTAAEWDYAGQDAATPRPDDKTHEDSRSALAVGTLSSNRFSLYDMDGNVAEWVNDCALKSASGETLDGCTTRAVRGRSWRGDLDAALLATTQRDDLGFRLARSLPP